jgi:hypothetical protein
MLLNKKKAKFLTGVIQEWKESSIISIDEADRLMQSFKVAAFDWKRLAKYSFWISIICIIIAIGSAFADETIIKFFDALVKTPIAGFAMFALIAGLFYYFGLQRRVKKPEKIFSNEAIFFLGSAFTAISIGFLAAALHLSEKHVHHFLLLCVVIFGVLGILFPSKLVWICCLLFLGSWFGMETGYMSGWGSYFLGMNYPIRFVLFGLTLTLASYGLKISPRLSVCYRPTYIMGLLYLFIALWILSIFGNYGDMNNWYQAKQIQLFHWAVLFGIASALAIAHGLKYDDGASRGFGLTFLFINLYTRYFEYFWNVANKFLFFIILAISFWILGSQAEKIWSLGLRDKAAKSPVDI